MLESAGLINQEPAPDDKRKMLIYPTTSLTISANQNNSELDGGVEINEEENNSETSGGVTPDLGVF